MYATATQARPAMTEDAMSNAQVVIVTESTWHFLGRVRGHIDRALMPEAPAVTCPIVDISHLSEDYDREVNNIYHAHVTRAGVEHVDVMIAELEKLGAVVTNRKEEEAAQISEAEFNSAEWFASILEKEF